MSSGPAAAGRHRIDLALSEPALEALRKVADRALGIEAARAAAEQHGRARALELLKGKRVMCDALSHGESVATRRDLDVIVPLVPGGPKKRKRAPRPGRPTNWPTTKAERDRVAARTRELQADPHRQAKRTDQAGTEHIRLAADASNGAAYQPTEGEVGPLSELTLRVAEAAGVDVHEMAAPYAEATCVDGEAGWIRRADGTSGVGVTVSLTDGTASLEFCSTRGNPITPAPLAAGEALLYNTGGGAYRPPTGDWRRIIGYDLPTPSASPVSTAQPMTIAAARRTDGWIT